jgi:ferredoxin
MNCEESILGMIDNWPCCALATVRTDELPERERHFFTAFMPQAITAIVLAHHVITEEEWTWYATSNGGERCDADDHVRNLGEAIRNELAGLGHDAELVKYPGQSGLQFRFVAQAAGLGTIGTNAFLFHPTWGPWVHLRVMATTAKLDVRPQLSGDQLCNQCGLCISACPADAISDDSFAGLQCRSYRQARGEYEPHGPRGIFPYCKKCVWICPQGQQPVPRTSDEENIEQN